MTSSLVGSEMCIRDSICAARLRFRIGCGGSGCRFLVLACSVVSLSWCCDCLLYTSDAADDM
eukprot:1083878-Prorocentrum_lima.AAC.1